MIHLCAYYKLNQQWHWNFLIYLVLLLDYHMSKYLHVLHYYWQIKALGEKVKQSYKVWKEKGWLHKQLNKTSEMPESLWRQE